MRSGEDQYRAHVDANPWGGLEKRHQYLSHLWLFAGLETMLSLWCGFISLRPQPRMVAFLWWPLHKSVLVAMQSGEDVREDGSFEKLIGKKERWEHKSKEGELREREDLAIKHLVHGVLSPQPIRHKLRFFDRFIHQRGISLCLTVNEAEWSVPRNNNSSS